jgi:hypothetical protein
MSPVFVALLTLLASTFQTRAAQHAEIAALRHQIAVLQRSSPRRLRLKQPHRLLWILLSRLWSGWRRCVYIVKPDTVIRWHRTAFARYWTCLIRDRDAHGATVTVQVSGALVSSKPCPEKMSSSDQSALLQRCKQPCTL